MDGYLDEPQFRKVSRRGKKLLQPQGDAAVDEDGLAGDIGGFVARQEGVDRGDFARVGLPLQALLLATTLLVVPRVFPF